MAYIIIRDNTAFLKGKTWIIYHTQRQAALEKTGAITSIHLQYQKLLMAFIKKNLPFHVEKEVIAVKFQFMFPNISHE